MDDSLRSSDDLGLRAIWEEICIRVQCADRSGYWHAYDRATCIGVEAEVNVELDLLGAGEGVLEGVLVGDVGAVAGFADGDRAGDHPLPRPLPSRERGIGGFGRRCSPGSSALRVCRRAVLDWAQ